MNKYDNLLLSLPVTEGKKIPISSVKEVVMSANT